jgi:lysophospholipase L1-like esterase
MDRSFSERHRLIEGASLRIVVWWAVPFPGMKRSLPLLVLLLALAVPAQAAAGERTFYVSLGDSYAAGYQPGMSAASWRKKGFANQLVPIARRRGHDFELVNFACGGETTASFLERKGSCGSGPQYRGTQARAATRFLRRNRGEVGLVTVSLGGNDVLDCVNAPTTADVITCVTETVEQVERRLGRIVRRLRAAAGPRVRIVGITYPDVLLARWLTGQQADQDFARLSLTAFRDLINPALRKAYGSVRARFVDVTAATGAYDPLEETTTLQPYGVIPKPVAEVCRLTHMCARDDIHANTRGYREIAELIAATLPRRR